VKMKEFLAAMAMLFVCVLAIWVAFRLAPETWAMIAGVVFGLLASLPMCGIVVMLLLRGQRREQPPTEPRYYPPPPIVLLNPDPAGYGQFAPPDLAPAEYQLPPGHRYPVRRPAPQRPPRAFVDRAAAPYPAPEPAPWRDDNAYELVEADAWDAPAGEYPAWESPAPPDARNARILGY